MKPIKPRYLETRKLKNGDIGYYWNPPAYAKPHFGFKALGPDYVAAVMEAEAINKALDKWRGSDDSSAALAVVAPGSVGELMHRFQRSHFYTKTSEKTQEGYAKNIRYLLAYSHGELGMVRALNARRFGFAHADTVYSGLMEQRGVSLANHVVAVARRAWKLGCRWGLVDTNPWSGMELVSTEKRKVTWTDEQIALFLETSKREQWPEIGLALLLAFELCQRQGDVLAMEWSQYQDGKIIVEQSKTKTLVALVVSDVLKAELDRAYEKRSSNRYIVAMANGDRYDEHYFRKRVRFIREKAGLPSELWFMDMRRTGLTELGDAGATEDEIMAQSGHKSREVVGTYVMKTAKQAENAHAKRMALRKDRLNGANTS